MASSKAGGETNLDSVSTSSQPPKQDTSNLPRMLTRSEIESLRQSKAIISANVKAELARKGWPVRP